MEGFNTLQSFTTIDCLSAQLLEHILGYVVGRRNRKDILSCRLVSSSWNTLILKTLAPIQLSITFNELLDLRTKNEQQKTETRFNLTSTATKLLKKLNLVSTTSNSPPPFTLKLTNKTIKGMIYEKTTAQYWADLFDKKITALLNGTDSLIYPITSIVLAGSIDLQITTFWNLLKLVSNTLNEVHANFGSIPSESTDMAQHLRYLTTNHATFPQLVSLTTTKANLLNSKLNSTFIALIKSASSLIKLHLAHDESPWGSASLHQESSNTSSDPQLQLLLQFRLHTQLQRERQGQLQLLITLYKSISTSISNLIEFECCIYRECIATILTRIKLNHLRTLIISENSNYTLQPEFGLFLQYNCPALKNLQLNFVHDSIGYFRSVQLNSLPTLPDLTHLGVSVSMDKYGYEGESCINQLMFMSERFVGLHVINIDLHTCILLSTNTSAPSTLFNFNNIRFPSVSTLVIKIDPGFRVVSPMKTYCKDLLHNWCPNLQKLVIDQADNELCLQNESEITSRVLYTFLNIEGIISLEFKNQHQLWLNELLKCGLSTATIRRNLVHLRLCYPTTQEDYQNLGVTKDPEQLLNCICCAFPKLASLQIDEEILRYNGSFNTEEILSKIKSLKEKYPSIAARVKFELYY